MTEYEVSGEVRIKFSAVRVQADNIEDAALNVDLDDLVNDARTDEGWEIEAVVEVREEGEFPVE